jgi:DNA-binding NarL/FixJ family response regulator
MLTTPVRVLLVEDHVIVRLGIRALLDASEEIAVLGETSNGREAVELCRSLKPDVVLMDVAMPELNGIDATRQIAAEFPEIRILMLSMHGEQQYLYESLRAGARGYVPKAAAFTELLAAIREVMAGRRYVSPSLADAVIEDYVRRAQGNSLPQEGDQLSAREREVIQLIAEGHSSAEVASALFISVRTVDTHRHNIMQKLKIRSVAGLTKFAIRNGLCSLNY